jgi:capsular exopolysaccharide synthesis family protein
MELRQYVMIVWKRWWLIALTTVLAGVAAFTVSRLETPTYRATTTIEISSGADPAQDPYNAIRDAEAIATTYVLQITSPRVIEAVLERLELAMEADKVQRDILAATQVRQSSLVEISAVHANPALAQALANTTAEVFIEQQTAQQQARYAGPLAELDAQVTVLEEKIKASRTALANLGDQENLSPAGRVEAARLETELTNDQTRLSVLLNSTEQFRLEMTKSGDYISVFSPAQLPEAPFKPQTLRNTALALVVGGMIGVGTAFLLDYLDDTIHTPADAQAALGVNVLGTMPDVNESETIGDLAASHPLLPAAEAFRSLRTSLQYASLDTPLRTLLFTSSAQGEGKSFMASNLATAFALTGKRVLLLDTDMRRPWVHRLWDAARTPGLTEALKAFADAGADGGDALAAVMDLVRPMDVEGLSLLTAGDKVSTPAELLNSQTFRSMLAALGKPFDMIVIDSPPILTVTDAAVIANHVDGVVLVTVSGETRLPMAARAIERITSVNGNLMGLVINRLSERSGGYYYRYYTYEQDYAYHGSSKDGQAPTGIRAWLKGKKQAAPEKA